MIRLATTGGMAARLAIAWLPAWAAWVALVTAAPGVHAAAPGEDPARGREAIMRHGCLGCHAIPGIPNPGSDVGPPLDKIGSRGYIAGVLANTPDNMRRWLLDPLAVDPRTAMPATGLTEQESRDIAAYLYTLK